MADEVTNYKIHKYQTTNHLGQDVLYVSGVAAIEVDNPRTDKDWHRWEVDIQLDDEEWEGDFDVEVPNVSLASISNNNHAVDAAWAVDEALPHEIHDKPYIRAKLALKDKDGKLHRVCFTAMVVGEKIRRNFYPGISALPTHVLQKALDDKIKKAK